jgi:hypothetical protein
LIWIAVVYFQLVAWAFDYVLLAIDLGGEGKRKNGNWGSGARIAEARAASALALVACAK